MVSKVICDLIISLIRCYRYFVSPMFPPACRFRPTCSEYAIIALRRFGIVKGILLTIYRVLKCQPFHPGGHDPVPDAGPECVLDAHDYPSESSPQADT